MWTLLNLYAFCSARRESQVESSRCRCRVAIFIPPFLPSVPVAVILFSLLVPFFDVAFLILIFCVLCFVFCVLCLFRLVLVFTTLLHLSLPLPLRFRYIFFRASFGDPEYPESPENRGFRDGEFISARASGYQVECLHGRYRIQAAKHPS